MAAVEAGREEVEAHGPLPALRSRLLLQLLAGEKVEVEWEVARAVVAAVVVAPAVVRELLRRAERYRRARRARSRRDDR
mgnify:FL=1